MAITLPRHRKKIAGIVSAITLVSLGVTTLLQLLDSDKPAEGVERLGRHLLQSDDDDHANVTHGNCTPRLVDQFPPDAFTPEERTQGAVAMHICLALYLFCAIAVVCDDYFVASLESICEVLSLQADVAGASFMALGSSAPEFFLTLIGLFMTKSELFISHMVGSAVFNLLFVIGVCGLGSGMIIYVTWWPLFRDGLAYVVSVCVLVAVIYDQHVYWYEAFIMLALYIAYLVFLYFNKPVGDYLVHRVNEWRGLSKRKQAEARREEIQSERTRLLSRDTEEARVSESSRSGRGTQRDLSQGGLKRERRSSLRRTRSESKISISYHISPVDYHVSEYESPLTWPESVCGRVWWVFMLPASLLFFLTIPDCRRPGLWQRMFFVTFAMAFLWIGGLSYVLVWMVTVAGDTIGIPDPALSLTFVAIATSVPDLFSSLFVAKDGYGDMAVANAIGSNICDLLLCLGLPWFLKTGVVNAGSFLHVPTTSLLFSSLSALLIVVFLLVCMMVNGWKLNKKFGALCLLVYGLMVMFAVMYEMNVFGLVNLPPC